MEEKPKRITTKKRVTLGGVAMLLIVATFLGQLLGFMRTRLVNANFYSHGPQSTDAYFAAFNIPDFFFYTLSAGALGVAFMPVLTDKIIKGDRKGMWELCSSLLNLLSIVMFFVAIIIFVFAEPLIAHIVAPALKQDPRQLHNAATIMRWLALNPLLFTLSGILTSAQQAMGRFFFYAIAPLFYNASIIASIYIFRNTKTGLIGLGIGACVGAVLQLIVVCVGLFGTKFRWNHHIAWRDHNFRTILRNLPPRSLDQGIDQVQSIVETHYARNLGEGYISYYNNAYTLQTAPILLLGTAISTAAFPRLNKRLSQGRPDLFRKDFLRILRMMVWLTIPVVVVCFFCRGYLARLIFAKDAQQISLIFGFLTVAIFFRVVYTIISRWFYAQKDTRTPLFVSIFTIALNITLVAMLARPKSYGASGLAMAQSIVAGVEVVILSVIMLIRDNKLFDTQFWGGLVRIVSASGFSVLTAFVAVSFFPLGAGDRGIITLGTKLLFIAGSTIVVHIGVSGLFGLEEARPIFVALKRFILRPVRIQY
ncbi:MAG: murein biosynthesis integral membrane protein MurJ [Candidatus Saccharibacteria bacterium]